MNTATKNNAPQTRAAAKPAATVTQQQPARETDKHVIAGKPALESALSRRVAFVPFQAKTPIELSASIVIEHFCAPTKKGARCTVSQAIRFIMLCKSRGLNPWEGDAYIVGYDAQDGPSFSLITAHQAYLKRAEIHPEFDGMESGVVINRGGEVLEYQGDMVIPGDTIIGAWAKVYFKKRKVPVYRRNMLARVKKTFGLWNSQPEMMCVKCAEADALRSAFPNTYSGMALEQVMDSEMMADAAAEITTFPETANHPEPPPFDREAVIRSIETQAAEAEKLAGLTGEKWTAMLATYGANKLKELADDQLAMVESQVAKILTDAAPPVEREPGAEG